MPNEEKETKLMMKKRKKKGVFTVTTPKPEKKEKEKEDFLIEDIKSFKKDFIESHGLDIQEERGSFWL